MPKNVSISINILSFIYKNLLFLLKSESIYKILDY